MSLYYGYRIVLSKLLYMTTKSNQHKLFGFSKI
jgi:hypothetical protein